MTVLANLLKAPIITCENHAFLLSGIKELIGNMLKIVMKWNTLQANVPGLKKAGVEPGIAQLPLLFGFRVEKPMETRVPDPIFI